MYTFFKFGVINIKKILHISLVLILLISSVFYQPKKVEANPLVGAVIPAGITVGTGAYVLGALGVAAIGGVVGWEYADEIQGHASRVWESGSNLAKTSLEETIRVSKDTGNFFLQLGSDFKSWTDDSMKSIVGVAVSGGMKAKNLAEGIRENLIKESYEDKNISVSVSTAYPGADIKFRNVSYETMLTVTFPLDSVDKFWTFNNTDRLEVAGFNYLSIHLSNGKISIEGRELTYGDSVFIGNLVSVYNSRFLNKADNSIPLETLGITKEDFISLLAEIYTVEDFISLVTMMGLDNVIVGNSDIPKVYDNAKSKTREAWEDMKGSGLYLPSNDAIPVSGGIGLSYNPTDDTYRFPSGVLWDGTKHDPITWEFPKVRVVIDSVTGQPIIVTDSRAPGITTSDGYVTPGEITGTDIDIITGNPVVGNPIVDTNVGFWSKLWDWLKSILDAIKAIPKLILDGLAALFIPTLALSVLTADLVDVLGKKFTMPGELIPILTGSDYKGYCLVDDMYVDIYGKKMKVFNSQYILSASDWYVPILRGLLWFLFGWYCVRKFIGIWNKVGGVKL